MSTAYPYWDAQNRYLVAGVTGKETVFAQIFEHPTGFWRWYCFGGSPSCPARLGELASSLANAQTLAQSHCQSVHYVSPPGSGPPVTPNPPLILDITPDFGSKNAAFTLSVNGQNFTATCAIYFDGTAETTTLASATRLSCAIASSQLPTDRSYAVQVVDQTAGRSNVLYFTATT